MSRVNTYYRALILDIVLVIVFALLGTLSHHHTVTPGLLAQVAWPFLVGVVLAHLVLQAWKVEPTRLWPHAVFIVAITVATGMVLRTVTGAGTATAFIIVSIVVNTLFLVGWRVIALALGKRRRSQ